MYRKLFLLTVLLLALTAGGSVWAAPAAQTEAPEAAGAFLPGDEPNDAFTAEPNETLGQVIDEIEPNDTPAQGQVIVFGDIVQGQTPSGDIDHFRFNAQAEGAVALTNGFEAGTTDPLPGVTLYDPAMQPVALSSSNDTLIASLPQAGVYTIAKSFLSSHPSSIHYRIYLTLLTGDEPANNTQAGATPIAANQLVRAAYDYPCDDDWYRFEARAGDVLPIVLPHIVTGSGSLARTNGTHYLLVKGAWWTYDDGDRVCPEGPYSFTAVTESLWISARVDGLGGAANKKGDILVRGDAPGSWRIVFDASDVGITRNVVAFDRLPNGSILMSLDGPQNVPGLGQVTPQDIIRFVPTSLGANTAGSFVWFLDGSDVGLTTTGERIDAISMQPFVLHPLHISLSGTGTVPRQSGGDLTIMDEDLINLVGVSYGADSQGKWRMTVDGSTVPGMAAEDLTAVAHVPDELVGRSSMLWGFDSPFTIQGMMGTPKDVTGQGGMVLIKNMAAKPIDAMAIGPAR